MLFKSTRLRHVVGRDLAGPHDERSEEAAELRRPDRRRQHGGGVPLHDPDDRAVAARLERHLGRHGRRQRPGDARRRQDVERTSSRNVPGLKPNAWIPTVDASHSDAGTAYVAADHHQDDDYAPYAFMTTDYGKTWTRDHRRPAGVGGLGARRARGSAQPQPALHRHRDGRVGVVGQGRALDRRFAATCRRPRCATSRSTRATTISCSRRTAAVSTSWTTSTALQNLGAAQTADATLFDVRPATRWVQWSRDGNLGQKKWTGENPPAGALITYFLKAQPSGEVNITISTRTAARCVACAARPTTRD